MACFFRCFYAPLSGKFCGFDGLGTREENAESLCVFCNIDLLSRQCQRLDGFFEIHSLVETMGVKTAAYLLASCFSWG